MPYNRSLINLLRYQKHKGKLLIDQCHNYNDSLYLTVTLQVQLVEQDLLTFYLLCSPSVLCRVRAGQNLASCVMFCRSLFVFKGFFTFEYCVVYHTIYNLMLLIVPVVS